MQHIARTKAVGVITALSDLLREIPFIKAPNVKYAASTQIAILVTFILVTISTIPDSLSINMANTIYRKIDITLPILSFLGSTL